MEGEGHLVRHGGTESRRHKEKYKSRHRDQKAGSGAQRSRGPRAAFFPGRWVEPASSH